MKNYLLIRLTTLVCVAIMLLNCPHAFAQGAQGNGGANTNVVNIAKSIGNDGKAPDMVSVALLVAEVHLNNFNTYVEPLISIWTILGILVLVFGSIAIYYLYKTAKDKLYPPVRPTNSVPSVAFAAYLPNTDMQAPLLEGGSLDIEYGLLETESVTNESEWPYGIDVVIDRSGASPQVLLSAYKFTNGELVNEEETKSTILGHGLNPPMGVNYVANGQPIGAEESPIRLSGNVVIVENVVPSPVNSFTLEVSNDLLTWTPVINIASQYATNRIFGLHDSQRMFFRVVLP